MATVGLLVAAACSSDSSRPHRPREDPALAARGESLANTYGCVSCHSPDGSARVGPTWKRLYGSVEVLEGGATVRAGEAYLRESVNDPDAKTVKGFPRGVMAGAIKPGSIPERDVDALVAYIRSLR